MEKSSTIQPTSLAADDPRLQKFRVFSELSPNELANVLLLSDSLLVPAGARIVQCGEEGHCLYVIIEGSVRVSVNTAGKNIELSHLESGDFFGEISLVDDGPRTADVVATEDCTLLRITRMTIGVLAGTQPSAAIQLLSAIGRALVRRLRQSNQKYVDILLRSGA